MVRIWCLLIGYACGLFQTSYIIGKLHHTDIRKHGSGNAGTTNALRTFGLKAGVITLLCDLLKCVAAVCIVRAVFRTGYKEILPLLGLYAGFGCVLGHNFPVYLGFKGGKGVAASLGFAFAMHWTAGILSLAVFFIIFFTTHLVSLGSLLAYTATSVYLMIRCGLGGFGMAAKLRIEFCIILVLMLGLTVFRHRENIKRLMNGSENKVYLHKKKD